MGGAASTEASPNAKKGAINDDEILKTTKAPRTKKHEFKGDSSSSNFLNADRSFVPGFKEFDFDQLKLDVLSAFLGGSVDPPVGNTYPDGVMEQVALCKQLASMCSGRDDIITKITAFLVARGSKGVAGIETLVLTGSAGTGVSTVIAKALVTAAQKLDDSNTTIVYRQIDSTTSTALLLVRSICIQLGLPVPTCPSELAISLSQIISYGTEDSPIALVLDGLNHLLDDSADCNLEWLVPVLVQTNNPSARVLVSTSPHPKSPTELALCRSLISCTILSLPSLSIVEARAILDKECASQKLPPLNEATNVKINAALELAIEEDEGISPCYIKLLVSGVLHPFLTLQHGYEILPDPIPVTPHEAFEKLLVFMEQHFPAEPQPAQTKQTNPPLNTAPIKIERDARKLMTVQALSVISLSRLEDGLTSNEIQQLLPPSPHSLPPSKPALPSVAQLLEDLNRAVPDLKTHLSQDSQGKWSWRHRIAHLVAEYRYHAIAKPSDTVGGNTPDEPTRILASAYADFVASQRRLVNSKAISKINGYIKDQPRLLCIAQKKNELLSLLLDIRFLVAMSKAWGGVSGLLARLAIYRRYALVERGIFLRRDRMDEFDAIMLIFERYRRVIEVGIREKKLEVVFKQILVDKVLDCPVATVVLEGFISKLRRKEENSRDGLMTAGGARAKTAATSVTQRVSFSLEEGPWVFEPRRDYFVDALGRESVALVSNSSNVEHQVIKFVTSSDGRYVVAVVGGNQIRVFEAGPFHEIWTIILSDTITAIAISPTGKTIAIATATEIKTYKTATGAKQVSIASIPTEKAPEPKDDSDLTPEPIEQPIDIKITHLVFSNDNALLLSTQIGLIYAWNLNYNWASPQVFKGYDIHTNPKAQETTLLAVSRDEYTCAWWETITASPTSSATNLSNNATDTSKPKPPQSTAKLSIFDMSLDTPSNALSHRVHLELPALTAPIQFNSKGTQIIVIENDSLYCVDAKSGDLAWSITTSNAGLTGDWANICMFKDFECNDALVGITVDGWAVYVTDGYVRWRVFLGLQPGDCIQSAAAMDGHLSIHKWNHTRNQVSVGHHIAYLTKHGGLFVIPLSQLGQGLKHSLSNKGSLADSNGAIKDLPAPDLTPVISQVVGVSCDIVSCDVIAVDATSVLHISTAQQIRVATNGDVVLYGCSINGGITVVTTKNVYSFASIGDNLGSQQFKESALSSTPKTYAHPSKILVCVAVPIEKNDVISTVLILLDSSNSIVSISVPQTGGPTVISSIQLDPSNGTTSADPIIILIPNTITEEAITEVVSISQNGRITIHSLLPGGVQSKQITKNVFQDSGSILGVPGLRDPMVKSAGISKDSKHIVVGDSNGGIRIVDASNPDGLEGKGCSGMKMASIQNSAIICLKWINDDEFVTVSADNMIAVWKVDTAAKKVTIQGLLDGGNSTPTCLDIIELSF
ncbi:UNVERIFIED_CONTAM: hypothetical protein HDU68_002533, partial [Siphonaria sp. JEL0065]